MLNMSIYRAVLKIVPGRTVRGVGINITRTLSTSKLKTPVMVNEVLQYLDVNNGDLILDMTFGSGGHCEAILQSSCSAKVVTLDRDPSAFDAARAISDKYPGRVIPLLGCFSDLPSLLSSKAIKQSSFNAVLLDVGCSETQLADKDRGFNPNLDGPLDMRMDGTRVPDSISAGDVLAKANDLDLHKILRIYGGEKQSKKIAKAIVSYRYTLESLQSTYHLKDFIKEVLGESAKGVTANVFRALRMFVNNELNELNYGLLVAEKYLMEGGRLVVLTYCHEEDLIVKRHIKGPIIENNPSPMPLKYYSHSYKSTQEEIEHLQKSPWSPLTKHVVTASRDEVLRNPTSLSVKLRPAMKL